MTMIVLQCSVHTLIRSAAINVWRPGFTLTRRRSLQIEDGGRRHIGLFDYQLLSWSRVVPAEAVSLQKSKQKRAKNDQKSVK